MKRKSISMKIDEELLKQVDDLAKNWKPPLSRSQMIEWILKGWFISYPPTETAI